MLARKVREMLVKVREMLVKVREMLAKGPRDVGKGPRDIGHIERSERCWSKKVREIRSNPRKLFSI